MKRLPHLNRNVKRDLRLKAAMKQFRTAEEKYKKEGYSLDTMGHSLRGALAMYVECHFPKRPKNTWNYSHTQDPISWGARLSKDVGGGTEHSLMIHTPVAGMMHAHDINRIKTPVFV